MKLHIISPFKKKTIDIAWIEINTPAGNFVIQPGHVPMIATLTPDKEIFFCLKNGKQESFLIKQGTIDITRTDATLLLSQEL